MVVLESVSSLAIASARAEERQVCGERTMPPPPRHEQFLDLQHLEPGQDVLTRDGQSRGLGQNCFKSATYNTVLKVTSQG